MEFDRSQVLGSRWKGYTHLDEGICIYKQNPQVDRFLLNARSTIFLIMFIQIDRYVKLLLLLNLRTQSASVCKSGSSSQFFKHFGFTVARCRSIPTRWPARPIRCRCSESAQLAKLRCQGYLQYPLNRSVAE